MRTFLLLAAIPLPILGADVCDPRPLQGAYAFQLSGEARISTDGKPKPAVSVGNLTFDGHGAVTGYSSVQYAGFLQGNPTTGQYEAHTDCSISWSLQDDSGAFQHFDGKMTPDLARIEFHQSDPGGPQRGVMLRTPDSCSATTLKPQYHVAISGSFTPMMEGQESHHVAASGTAEVTGGGGMRFDFSSPPTVDGKIDVGSDCVVTIEIGGDSPMNLRGFLVNDGREILAMQTDPGYMVTARFTSQ